MSNSKYIRQNHNVVCDICGRKRKRSECRLAYGTGDIAVVMSCIAGCADNRQPLNSPPPLIFDGRPVLDARPDATANSKETYVAQTQPSYMKWGQLRNAPKWGSFNLPNNNQNLNGIWTWGSFKKE